MIARICIFIGMQGKTQALRDKTMPAMSKITTRYFAHVSASLAKLRIPSRMTSVLLAGLLGSGVSAGALVAGALAASVLPAQAPLSKPSALTLKTDTIAAAQPMPPMPDQVYDAQFHEGAVDLSVATNFAGIDPFITGPVPK